MFIKVAEIFNELDGMLNKIVEFVTIPKVKILLYNCISIQIFF